MGTENELSDHGRFPQAVPQYIGSSRHHRAQPIRARHAEATSRHATLGIDAMEIARDVRPCLSQNPVQDFVNSTVLPVYSSRFEPLTEVISAELKAL